MADRPDNWGRESWMTDAQYRCACLFADVVGGFHHIVSTIKPHGKGIRVSDFASKWATFDFNALTRIVVLAHDRMIRVEIVQSSPGRVGFVLHQRHGREGSMFERHPTLEDHVEWIRTPGSRNRTMPAPSDQVTA